MPYIIKLYDPEYLDIAEVLPAESFDDAVGKVLEAIELSPENEVHVTKLTDGSFQLKISRGGDVLADVEDVPFVDAFGRYPNGDAVALAINALAGGNASALTALFVTRP